ncbi:MAG: hypothetical protein WAK57_10540, partial [Desulfobacterales bacterium]
MTEKDKIRKYEKTAEATAADPSQEQLESSQDESSNQSDGQTAEINGVVEPEAKVEAARQEAQLNYDRFLRVSAEFDNYK